MKTHTEKLCKTFLAHFTYGGVTLSPEGEVLTSGIVVALNRHSEHIVPYGTKEYMKGYIWRWLEKLEGNNALGFWVDDEDDRKVYLDEVKVFPKYDIENAVMHAIQHDQIAVQLLNPNVTLRIT